MMRSPRAGEVTLHDCLWLMLLSMGALAVGLLAGELTFPHSQGQSQ